MLELTTISLEVTANQLQTDIKCDLCRAAFNRRIRKLLADWGAVKVCPLLTAVPNEYRKLTSIDMSNQRSI